MKQIDRKRNYGPLPGTNRTGDSNLWIDVVFLGFGIIITITALIAIIVG